MPIQDSATALIISANGGNESVMALLLDAKADLNHANSVRHFSRDRIPTLFLIVVLILMLIDTDVGVMQSYTMINTGAVNKHVIWDVIMSLDCTLTLRYICLVLHQDGATALTAAALVGHTPLITLLLDAKADVNCADKVS